MRKGIFITATDTGVGKTLISCGLSYALKSRGIDVGVMKPIATGAIKLHERLISHDVRLLTNSSGVLDKNEFINPYLFKKAVAPYAAAKLEKRAISVAKIRNAFNILAKRHQFIIVEGAGGLLVPMLDKFFILDLIIELGLPVIIVSRLGLGTINHTLLSIEAARLRGIEILGIIFNQTERRFGIAEKTNPDIITKISKIETLGVIPHIKDFGIKNLAKIVTANVNIEKILKSPSLSNKKNSDRLKRLDKKFIWHPFTQMKDYLKEEPVIIEEGRGIYIKDTDGRWYIDGVSSIWTNVHGHRNRSLDAAIREQLAKISHSTLLGLANVGSIELAHRLIEVAPKNLSKVFYSDNGSTSVEVALKMAFQYWRENGKPDKIRFITFENAYHGDTIGSVSLGGIDLFSKLYKPLLFNTIKAPSPYCYRCSFDKRYPQCNFECLDRLELLMKKYHKSSAALVIEPIMQGAAGMIVAPNGFLKEIRRLCTKYNIFMIADEVATGFGRTGRMFACQHEGVGPDIMTVAKGISGGYLPIAATLTTEKIFRGFLFDYKDKKTFFHGHTYTGNPLASAVAIANLDIFKKDRVLERLKPKVRFLSDILSTFRNLAHVGDIRQKGFMVGIELVKDKNTKEPYTWQERIGIKVIQDTRRNGLILRPLGNVIVLMPPLTTSEEELKKIGDITYAAIRNVAE